MAHIYIYFFFSARIYVSTLHIMYKCNLNVLSIYLQVEKVSDPNSKNAKYSVYFYGTGET